ncbi:hypothetical protein HY468_02215 [Candidatus Roizmanbacteria bacterium]|nr:hypothetical protein [Candidatus Roizmanbacteria bacterium]
MKRKIRITLKLLIFLIVVGLYFLNNEQLATLADRIEHEIVVPYSQVLFPGGQLTVVDPNAPTPWLSTSTTDISPVPTRYQKVIYVTPTPLKVNVTEDELWNALLSYRRTHGKSDVQKEERLCQYARKRAQELTERLKANPEDPLDNHAGFQRDADSGYVFETTGYNHIGENLAYTPGFTSATQVIEWGWDTSSSHRSLQLSEDVTHGCITGIHPIYVAIFTY